MNDTACKTIGVSPENIKGVNVHELFDEENRKRQKETVKKIVETGKPFAYEGSYKGRLYEQRGFPVFDTEGRVTRIAAFARDITEQRKMAKELEDFREKMFRAEQLASVGALSAAVAHEMNQPLTVMQLLLEQTLRLMDNNKSQKALTENINDCLHEVRNASRHINRLRDFARKSSVYDTNEIDLVNTAERIINALNKSFQHKNTELKLHVEGDIPPVKAGLGEIEQIFFVLLQNSLQAASEKQKNCVEVSFCLRNGRTLIKVSDDCGGIDKDHMDRIFEPFFTTKGHQKGTGLGLCVLDRIVSKLGGKISVRNDYGAGSTFGITL